VARVRPTGLCRYYRHGEKLVSPIVHNPNVAETLTEIEHNLERLTLDIPDAAIEDLPLFSQRHTRGVSGPISHFLQQVGQVIACYHDHHHA